MIGFFWWLRNPLYWWVKSKTIPANPVTELGIDPKKPVVYVVKTNSLSDLLVVEEHCLQAGLPLPSAPITGVTGLSRGLAASSYVYLVEMSLLYTDRSDRSRPVSPLAQLATALEAQPEDVDVQLVPVSVFWGRNPGKEEKSVFRLLFFDDEHAGMFQKIFIVLAQGRHVFANFGKPISLREQIKDNLGAETTARKVSRVLRVHFRSQRISMMGPTISGRSRLIASLLRTKPVRDSIEEEARKNNISLHRAEMRAKRYAEEIAADTRYPVIRAFEIILGYIWNRIFSGILVEHPERLRKFDQTHEIVYVPAHRSHMDYLLIVYTLYQQGLVPPHIMAGINLYFWPAGGILRRGGAFFVRRSFAGNRLYSRVYNEYVHALITRGYSLKFFPEGTRSRTGKLMPPKTGMLAMVVHSFLRHRGERPVVFVPIFVAYDRVMEIRTYLRELGGSKKKSESVGQLIQAAKGLRKSFGKAYIGVGQPIELGAYLDSKRQDWRTEPVTNENKPGWMAPIVHDLAEEVMTRINSSAIVYPSSLVATILLSVSHRAMAEDDLKFQMRKFLEILERCPYSGDIAFSEKDPVKLLATAEQIAGVQRFKHPGGDVLYLGEREAAVVTYYRNNTLHVFVLPSLVASFFQHNDEVPEDELLIGCSLLYPLLQDELFLRWKPEEIGGEVQKLIVAMIEAGVLMKTESGKLHRPAVTSPEFITLKVLGRTIGQTIERYSVAITLLSNYVNSGWFSRVEFEKDCMLMAQRISILNGISDPEFFNKDSFSAFIGRLQSLNYIQSNESGEIQLQPAFLNVAQNSPILLSADIRQSIQRGIVKNSSAAAGGVL